MDFDSFHRIVTTFADRPTDKELEKGNLMIEVRNELIEARLEQRPEGLTVIENDNRWPASRWITERIAMLPLLAQRLLDFVEDEPYFVPPEGASLDDINVSPDEMTRGINSVPAELLRAL